MKKKGGVCSAHIKRIPLPLENITGIYGYKDLGLIIKERERRERNLPLETQ